MDLATQDFGIAEAMGERELEQLIVGHAAPEEIREARGELEIVEVAGGLDAKEETRRDEDGFEGELDALVNGIALLAGGLNEMEEAIEFVVGNRPAVSPAREIGEIGTRA
jgi:hypothetical protein